MDFLISYKKILTGSLLVVLSFATFAQTDLVKAFENSYSYEAEGNYARALNVLQAVYQADSYELNLRIGWLYYLSGSISESVAYYSRAIALKPYGIEARLGIAFPLSADGRWDEVLVQYNKILEIDPQNSLTNYRIGLIYYNRKQYERAEAYLEKVVNLYPFDYDSMLLFAWIKFQLGKTREARVLFNKVLMHTPGDPSATEGLGLIR